MKTANPTADSAAATVRTSNAINCPEISKKKTEKTTNNAFAANKPISAAMSMNKTLPWADNVPANAIKNNCVPHKIYISWLIFILQTAQNKTSVFSVFARLYGSFDHVSVNPGELFFLLWKY